MCLILLFILFFFIILNFLISLVFFIWMFLYNLMDVFLKFIICIFLVYFLLNNVNVFLFLVWFKGICFIWFFKCLKIWVLIRSFIFFNFLLLSVLVCEKLKRNCLDFIKFFVWFICEFKIFFKAFCNKCVALWCLVILKCLLFICVIIWLFFFSVFLILRSEKLSLKKFFVFDIIVVSLLFLKSMFLLFIVFLFFV